MVALEKSVRVRFIEKVARDNAYVDFTDKHVQSNPRWDAYTFATNEMGASGSERDELVQAYEMSYHSAVLRLK